MGRRLDDVRLAVMMLDGIEIAARTRVVALGITTEGVKIPLGLWEGSTENATLARRCWPTSSTAGSMPSRGSCS
jgi:putative transposase